MQTFNFDCETTVQTDLFVDDDGHINLPEGAVLLRKFALPVFAELDREIKSVLEVAPFRNMKTPGGHTMSVAMTNCGELGWVSDKSGYKYVPDDPLTNKPWPQMSEAFVSLALGAAAKAGYPFFTPDACLINQYLPGTKLSLHQDKDEIDFSQPIVSVSLGLSAVFRFGGKTRRDPIQLIKMNHTDVFVWGGSSRLNFHGIRTIKNGQHESLGAQRINLTFRKAL
jgi:DNA oxidative demethylase